MIDVDLLSADERNTFKVYVAGGLDEKGGEMPDSAGFVIVGPHSAEFQRAQSKLGARAMKLMREKPATKAEGAAEVEPDYEEQWNQGNAAIRERSRLVAECVVVDFFGFASAGTPLPFSGQALAKIFDVRPLYAYLVMQAAENEANFTKG